MTVIGKYLELRVQSQSASGNSLTHNSDRMADKAEDGGFLAKELSLQAAVGLLLNSTTLFVVLCRIS